MPQSSYCMLLIILALLLSPALTSSQAPSLAPAPTPSNPAPLSDELLALQAFKNAISLDPSATLSSWDVNLHPSCCSCTGVTCDTPSHVEGLLLSGLQLQGTLSPSLGSLSSLAFLNLSSNLLSGAIPSELSQCMLLLILDISENMVSAPIPP
ncbi:hypothetical protein L7F22_012852 [Adiantum nelumboides]|nr:hypothetical protein [Adiantum nelumboides]